MDAFDATQCLGPVDPRAKIVILTDYDHCEFRRAAVGAGTIHYALKDNLPNLARLIELLRAGKETSNRS